MKKALALVLGALTWLGGAGYKALAQVQPAQRVALNLAQLRQQLAPAAGADARARQAATYRISLPTLGGTRPFVLAESFVLPAVDAAAQQRLRTFVGYEEGAPEHRASVVLSPQALTADVLAGSESASLRPATDGSGAYLLQAAPPTTGPCATKDGAGLHFKTNAANLPAPYSFGTQLRRIRYAILVTKEFYDANKGASNNDANVEQAVATALNQMSALYLRELAVSYELVKPTNGLYYFSAMTTATLPSSANPTAGEVRQQNLGDVSDIIGSRFGTGTYDLGHCYHINDGGVAYVGIICNSTLLYRAGAWSGVGSSGFQQVLAHEMGHQHGASHTFAGPCGSNADANAVEPGGGATIMGYTYVCNVQTLQGVGATEEDHFNAYSLNQMRTHLQSPQVVCPVVTANSNQAPTLNAGPDYVIPRNTPFTLMASGTDPDAADVLTYTWNQFDYTTNRNALGTIVGTGGLAAVDDPAAPLFRPRPPRAATSRTFPDLRYVLANSNHPANILGEALPNVGRTLNFVVTARDERPAGGTFTTDNVTLTVAPNAGPFAVTTQNTAALWIRGQPAIVTWSVNNTDQAPVSAANVRITLSTDGGQTFPTVLAASTPNDGSEVIAVPSVTTTSARVRVEAVGNIFFDINDVDFPIGPCAPVASQILPATALSAAGGDATLNLTENAYSLTELTGANQLSGTITNSDPVTNLLNYNGTNCTVFSNDPHYDIYSFEPTVTGSYVISNPVRFANMGLRIYLGGIFDATNPCQNLIAGNYNGGLSATVTVSLVAGQLYTVLLSNFTGSPNPNSTYTVAFSNSNGGTAYAPLQREGYDYQYVVVNTATNSVVQLTPTADLRTRPAGTYEVYGLLFQRGYDMSGVVGNSLSSLQTALGNAAPCGRLSNNVRTVTITSTPLPVALVGFTAEAAGTGARLRWNTASETDNDHFDVEASADGRTFARVGAVAGHGTTLLPQQYVYTDENLARYAAALVYYRLRQVDGAGTATYSPVRTVAVAASKPTLVLYPTALEAGQALSYLYTGPPVAAGALLEIYDATGRRVATQALAGPTGTVAVAALAPGWYWARLAATGAAARFFQPQ